MDEQNTPIPEPLSQPTGEASTPVITEPSIAIESPVLDVE